MELHDTTQALIPCLDSKNQTYKIASLLFEHSHEGILIADASGHISDVNQRYLEMTGLQKDELLGCNILFHDVTHPHREPTPEWEAFLASNATTLELTTPLRDCRSFSRHIKLSSLTDHDGQTSIYIAHVEDQSSLRTIEKALHASATHLDQIIEGFPQPVIVLNKDHLITHWNHACEIFFGAKANEMIGTSNQWKPFYKVPRPVMADLVLDQDEEGLLPRYYGSKFRPSEILPGTYEAEDFFPHFGEEGRWLYFTATAIRNAEGEIIGAIETLIDITEQKRAETEVQNLNDALESRIQQKTMELQQAMQQLIQSEKLASLGSLVAGVAHELNTPIGNMLTLSTTLNEHAHELQEKIIQNQLKRSVLDSFLSVVQESTQLFEHNARKAGDLISSFKQVAVDQSSSRIRNFQLKKTVEDVLTTLRPMLKKTNHNIQIDIPDTIQLTSYPGPLEQVFTNLINNACIHAFANSNEAGCIAITASAMDEHLVLSFSDNGRGMDAETQRKLFDPFFTTSLGNGGSGLGMYITYNIVTVILGGTIQADSTLGQGTTYTISLPLTSPERTQSNGTVYDH